MRRLEAGRGGVIAIMPGPCGGRRPVAECASCGVVKPVKRRGLCRACESRHVRDGSIGQYGWVKADRMAEYASLRPGLSVPEAAARAGVSVRTASRYEAELRDRRPPS